MPSARATSEASSSSKSWAPPTGYAPSRSPPVSFEEEGERGNRGYTEEIASKTPFESKDTDSDALSARTSWVPPTGYAPRRSLISSAEGGRGGNREETKEPTSKPPFEPKDTESKALPARTSWTPPTGYAPSRSPPVSFAEEGGERKREDTQKSTSTNSFEQEKTESNALPARTSWAPPTGYAPRIDRPVQSTEETGVIERKTKEDPTLHMLGGKNEMSMVDKEEELAADLDTSTISGGRSSSVSCGSLASSSAKTLSAVTQVQCDVDLQEQSQLSDRSDTSDTSRNWVPWGEPPLKKWVPPIPGYMPSSKPNVETFESSRSMPLVQPFESTRVDRKYVQLVVDIKAEIASKVTAMKMANEDVKRKGGQGTVETTAVKKQEAEMVAAKATEDAAAAAYRKADEEDAADRRKSSNTKWSPPAGYAPRPRRVQGAEETQGARQSAWQAREEKAMSIFSEMDVLQTSGAYRVKESGISPSPSTTLAPTAPTQVQRKADFQEQCKTPASSPTPNSRKWVPPVGYGIERNAVRNVLPPVEIGKQASSSKQAQAKEQNEIHEEEGKSAVKTVSQTKSLSLSNAGCEPILRRVKLREMDASKDSTMMIPAHQNGSVLPSESTSLTSRLEPSKDINAERDTSEVGGTAPLQIAVLDNTSSEAQRRRWSPPSGYEPAARRVQLNKEIEIEQNKAKVANSSAQQNSKPVFDIAAAASAAANKVKELVAEATKKAQYQVLGSIAGSRNKAPYQVQYQPPPAQPSQPLAATIKANKTVKAATAANNKEKHLEAKEAIKAGYVAAVAVQTLRDAEAAAIEADTQRREDEATAARAASAAAASLELQEYAEAEVANALRKTKSQVCMAPNMKESLYMGKYIHTYLQTNVHVQTQKHACIHTYIHTYIHTFMQTNVYTNMHSST